VSARIAGKALAAAMRQISQKYPLWNRGSFLRRVLRVSKVSGSRPEIADAAVMSFERARPSSSASPADRECTHIWRASSRKRQ
jgi:hypothetical protein